MDGVKSLDNKYISIRHLAVGFLHLSLPFKVSNNSTGALKLYFCSKYTWMPILGKVENKKMVFWHLLPQIFCAFSSSGFSSPDSLGCLCLPGQPALTALSSQCHRPFPSFCLWKHACTVLFSAWYWKTKNRDVLGSHESFISATHHK